MSIASPSPIRIPLRVPVFFTQSLCLFWLVLALDLAVLSASNGFCFPSPQAISFLFIYRVAFEIIIDFAEISLCFSQLFHSIFA